MAVKSSGSFSVGENAPRQCTAMSKRSGKQCKGPAIVNSPNARCRMHGGIALVGAEVHNFKHGRHSKYLPSKLDKLYREALSNPDLLEMNDHIALLEARIQDVLSVSAEGDPAPRWSQIREIFDGIATAVAAGNHDRLMVELESMAKALDAGQKWDRAWDQITDTMEQLRKMTDTEVKRKKELNQMVPVERVVAMMAAVGMAVKRNVTNPDEIQAVYRELAVLHGSDRTPDGRQDRLEPTVIDVPRRKRKVVAIESTV